MARAQADEIQRTSVDAPNNQKIQTVLHFKSSKNQTSPTFQQLLQREGSKWSKISAQKRKNHELQEDHHKKKSVLAKVKEKAKKWRNFLSRKNDNDSRCTSVTRLSSAGPKDKGEEDAQFQSARTSESKHAPDINKQASRDHPQEAPINTRTVADSKIHAPADIDADNQALATADALAHDLQESGSRFSRLAVSTSESGPSKAKTERSVKEEENMKGGSQTRDKGVSVKEYLMHKFEPGEDERALSQVITQTISPRRDKMREAMSSFLKNEEPSESTSKLSNSEANSSDAANITNPVNSSDAANSDTKTKSDTAPINPRHDLGSHSSNASLNLNETFRSTIASYQNHKLGSSPHHNTSLSNSSATSSGANSHSTKTSSSPLGQLSSANETQAPTQTNTDATQAPVSSPDRTQVPGHTNTNVRRVPVSSSNQTQVPSHTETNTIRFPLSTANQTQAHGQTEANPTRSSVSTGNESRSPVNNNADTTRVPGSTNNNEVMEGKKWPKHLQAN